MPGPQTAPQHFQTELQHAQSDPLAASRMPKLCPSTARLRPIVNTPKINPKMHKPVQLPAQGPQAPLSFMKPIAIIFWLNP